MAKLPYPIYLKSPIEDPNVFALGKAPELYALDYAAGVARIGGGGRHPSYFFSYFSAAKKMIEDARIGRTYDDIGLPAFYLLRHASELLLKRLIEWCHEIIDLEPVGSPLKNSLSNKERERLTSSHNLEDLLRDLKKITITLGLELPNQVSLVINEISNHEITETFSRYDRSINKKVETKHVEKEVILPIVKIQAMLDEAVAVSLYQIDTHDSLESELYYLWQRKTFPSED